MTRYEQGFLTKCAEYGLDTEQSAYLLKSAGGFAALGRLAGRAIGGAGKMMAGAGRRMANAGRKVLGRHAGVDFQGNGIMGSGLRGFADNLTGRTGRNFMNNIEGRGFKDLAASGKKLLKNPSNTAGLAQRDAKTLSNIQRWSGGNGAWQNEHFGKTMTNAAERQAARISAAQNRARVIAGTGVGAAGLGMMSGGEDNG